MRYSAHGTQMQMGDAADPEVFTKVAQVRDITGPGLSTNIITANDHDSGGIATKLAGIRDGGQVTFDVAYDPADPSHEALIDAWRDRGVHSFKIIFTDDAATEWDFQAIVQQFSPSAPVEDALTASVTLEVTGEPVLGA